MMITGQAKLAGVMGWPVGHSRSPRLHGFWLAQYGIDGAYIPLAVRPEDLPFALRALVKLGFAGANLTIPHKEAALGLVDVVEDSARAVGAVNTVTVAGDGRLIGSNSDVEGFAESIRAAQPGFAAKGPCVVLGAGGAARAVAAGLISLGARRIRLVNRTTERAVAVAEALAGDQVRFEVVNWTARAEALAGASVLVNATSLGMRGGPALDLELDLLPAGALVVDIVYVPLVTPLLAAAAARDLAVVDGLGMLLYQARAGFDAWFGVLPEVSDALRAFMRADLEKA